MFDTQKIEHHFNFMKNDLLSCTHTLLHRLYKAASIWCLCTAAAAVVNNQPKNSFATLVQLPVIGVKACFVPEYKSNRGEVQL